MSKPSSRQQFKEYCLRKLGAPVIQINVTDEQVDDRVDEALDFWQDYHYNGMEHVYLKHEITEDDISNGYIPVPEDLVGVTKIFNLSSSISSGSGMFNTTYQFVLNNVTELTGYSIQNYFMSMQNLRFMEEWLVGLPMIRYNKHINRIYLDMNAEKLTPGNYILVDGYAPLDGTTMTDIWSDRWLQNYASVLIKEQWGSNLTKFNNMQLVGGIQFNGEQILNDAREERRNMEEEAKNSLQPLVFNFSG